MAHMLDVDGAVDGLAALAGHRPMLGPGQISLLGLGPHTDFEAEVISDRELPVVDVQMAAADPRRSARAALAPLSACDGLAVHFDVDQVDFLRIAASPHRWRRAESCSASCSPTRACARSP